MKDLDSVIDSSLTASGSRLLTGEELSRLAVRARELDYLIEGIEAYEHRPEGHVLDMEFSRFGRDTALLDLPWSEQVAKAETEAQGIVREAAGRGYPFGFQAWLSARRDGST